MTTLSDQAAQQAAETRILQKVNAAHRQAFGAKFPGQVEHCMRLTAERLQLGLRKDSDTPLTDASVRDLAEALYRLWQIHQSQRDPGE